MISKVILFLSFTTEQNDIEINQLKDQIEEYKSEIKILEEKIEVRIYILF